MSNQSDQKIDALSLNRMTFLLSSLAILAVAAIGLFYPPVIVVQAFFLFQAAVRYVAYYRKGIESRFTEILLTSPAKLLTALAMMSVGIPKDNLGGVIWVGVALMFVLSGATGLYKVMNAAKVQPDVIAEPERIVTASQRKKEAKMEQALLNDLAEFLNRPDSEDK
jgi:hypothetical protein